MKINNKINLLSPLSHLFFFKSLETTINTTLNMLNNRIENIAYGSSDYDAATLGHIEDLLQESSSVKFLSLTGTKPNEPVTGDLTFDGKSTISNISSPVNDTDAVPLSTISSITNKFLTTKGTSNEDPFTGDISFDGSHLITGLANPVNPSDAVNLQTLRSHIRRYFLKSGDTLSGPLNINNQTLSNLANPSNPTDAANLQTITQLVTSAQETFIPLIGTSPAKPLTGSLTLNNTKIIDLGIATKPSEAVNLDLLNTTLNNYLSLSGGIIEGNLNLNNHRIENVGTPTQDLDLINKEFLITSLNSFVKLSGSILSGNINLGNNKIINLKDPQLSTDGVNLQTMKSFSDSHLKGSYIPYTGTLTNTPVTGNLTFNSNSTVTGLADPSHPKDIINLQTLQKTVNNYLPLSGGSLIGDLDLNNQTLSNLSNPTTDNSALNLQTLDSFIKNNQATYVPYTGTTLSSPITGNLVLNDTRLTQIPSAKNPSDIINLEDLNKTFSDKFLLAGDSLSGSLNMKNNKIINLSNPKEDTEAVNLENLNTRLNNYLSLTGGSINYELNINNQAISGLRDPSLDTEAINLRTFNKTASTLTGNFIPLTGNTSSKPITGDFIFDNLHLLTGLSVPEENSEAVNLLFLNTTGNKYLLLQGGSLTGALNMNNKNITNLPDITNDTDLSQLINRKTMENKFSLYLPLSGGTLTGVLNCNNNTLSNLTSPTEPSDIVNKAYLTNYLNAQANLLIPLSGNNTKKEISGNLTFQEALVTGLANPVQDTDAVNLQTLNSKLSTYMSLSGGTLTGPLSLNNQKITNLSDPINNGDAVPLKYAQKHAFSQVTNYIKLSGTDTNSPIIGNLTFNNSLVTGLADPSHNTDAVNLQTLNSKFSTYMSLSGGTLTGPLSLNNQKIINLSMSINNGDAVPLKYAQKHVSSQITNYINLAGTNTLSSITGNLTFSNALVTGLASPKNPSEAVNLKTLNSKLSPYMPLSGGVLTGLLSLNTQKIINLSNPNQDTDAVNLQTLNSKFSSYMPLSGGTLTGPLSLNIQKITNLSSPINNGNAVNLQYIQNYLFSQQVGTYLKLLGTTTNSPITGNLTFSNALVTGLASSKNPSEAVNLETLNSKLSPYMPLSGGTLSGTLSLNNQKITNLSLPINNGDIVPLKYAQKHVSSQVTNYIKLAGTTTNSPITGNLTFSNALVTGLASSKNPSEAVNLETLNSKLSLYMPLSGGTLSGTLSLDNQTIINIPYPKNPLEAVPYKYAVNKYNQETSDLLKYSGSTNNSPITGNLTFNNALVTGLASPKNPSEAVNLETLTSKFSTYIPLSGGVLTGYLSLNTQKITNLSIPLNNGDAVPLKYAHNYLSQQSEKYLKLSGTDTTFPITGNLTFNNALVTGLASPKNPLEIVNLETLISKFSTYMPLSGGTLTGLLSLNTQKIIHLSSPINNNDSINLQTLTSKFSTCMPLSGGTLTGNLILTQPLLNIPTPKNSTEAVPYKYALENYISKTALFLKYSGSTDNSPITGNLIFNNSLVTGLASPTQNTDAVNFQTVISKFSNYMPLLGGKLVGKQSLITQKITNLSSNSARNNVINLNTLNSKSSLYFPLSGSTFIGPISVNEISNIQQGTTNSSAVSYGQAQDLLSTKILPLSGNSLSNPVTHNFTFNNSYLITGLQNPIDTGDAVNLQTLNSKFSNYLPLSGGTMTGSLNVNNKTINNMTENSTHNLTQALIMKNVKNFFFTPIMGEAPFLSSRTSYPMWNKNTLINFFWGNNPYNLPNSQKFYTVPGKWYTNLNILSPGLHIFTFSMLTNTFSSTQFITINLEHSSTSKVLAVHSVSELSSVSFTLTIYIEPSYSNPYITMYNDGSEDIPVHSVNWTINKIFG